MSLLALAILLPLVAGSASCFLLGRPGLKGARHFSALAAALVAAASLACYVDLAPAVMAGQVVLAPLPWVPEIGLSATLRLDGLALMFAVLITGMGLLVIAYAHQYLGPDDPPGRLFALLMVFMSAMLGIVTADNLLLLVVFWELTSVSSFLLVGYWGHRADARSGARMALAVTGGGGLALLAGVVLIGQIAGTLELSELLSMGPVVQAHPLYPVALGLVLLGCFTKSAQFPFHFWLPEAMAAPTPVSAYLHSATMVKAGIFLLARLHPVLGGTGLFEALVCGAGLLTLTFGAYVAIFRHDLKGLLAYSTISHLGLIVFLLGLSSPLATVAAIFHVMNHAVFKASLFMTAGIVDHETGTRDMRRLGGLLRLLPWTATAAMLAAAAMAGVPPFNGFLSKEMYFAEALQVQGRFPGAWLVPVVAMVAAACSVAYSVRFIHDTFFHGEPRDLPRPSPHEPSWLMRAPVLLLAVASLVLGLTADAVLGPFVKMAAEATRGMPLPVFHLTLWHGLNMPLMMSVVALLGGGLLYMGLLHHGSLHLHHPRGITGRLLFTRFVEGLTRLADAVISRVDGFSLQRHVLVFMLAVLVLGASPLWGHPLPLSGERARLAASPLAIGLWLLALGSASAVVLLHRRRFLAVVLVGGVGLVTAVTFMGLSAADLALTQLSVEVVSTVLLLMGLALLPAHSPLESAPWRRVRDGAVALAVGGGVGWLCWIVLTHDLDSISGYFLQHALPEGGGRNIVNVILVDFRGYDTFGEITVLAIAGVAAFALLEGLRVRRAPADATGRPWGFERKPLMLRVAAAFILPMGLLISAYIFWRGHNQPGGGFVAGLVTACALLLQYMALGQERVEGLLRVGQGRLYTRWIVFGLGMACLTGMAAFAFGRPFFTSAFVHPVLPVVGELGLASAALFDLGVYATVVGSTLLMLAALGRASREPGHGSGVSGDAS